MDEEDLKKVLRYVYMLIGIRGQNFPAGADKEFLHGYIRLHYGQHTADEVRMAFDMAVQGRLGVDANCYENFSVAYFAGIMNAFRRWSGGQAKALETLPPGEKAYTAAELKKIDDEYQDYLLTLAFRKFQSINKLPCQWPKVNLKTK